jgi:glycosyltransferase involved in cell wall biosynthesis
MRIGIDIRPLQNNNRFRGIGRYLENTLLNIDLDKNHTYTLFYEGSKKTVPDSIKKIFKSARYIQVPPRKINKVKYIRALVRPYSRIKPRRSDIDVLFQADPWLGIPKNIPTVVAFHDIIPLLFKIDKESVKLRGIKKYKQLFGEHTTDKFYSDMLKDYKNADRIVAISEHSKRDFIKYVNPNINKDHIRVTLLSGDLNKTIHTKTHPEKTLAKYKVKKNMYILYVGGIDKRKNIKGLLTDFIELKKQYKNLKLVVVGKEFNIKRGLEEVGWTELLNKNKHVKDDIIIPGYVPDSDLANLYENTIAFVFPSLYEGFGLPVLEAMEQKCPVICYQNSSLTEVAGNAALLVENGKPMVNAIDRLMNNPELRKQLILKGLKQAKKFSWKRSAQKTMQSIEELG